jgi:toxin secretion/phage lysis holin
LLKKILKESVRINMKNIIDAVIAFLGGICGFLFGAVDGLFYALVGFVVLDYVTGIIVAIIRKELSSNVGFHGICKKILMFAVVALANIVDVQIIGDGSTLRTAVIFVFLANEGLSLLENVGNAGITYPAILKNALSQLKPNDIAAVVETVAAPVEEEVIAADEEDCVEMNMIAMNVIVDLLNLYEEPDSESDVVTAVGKDVVLTVYEGSDTEYNGVTYVLVSHGGLDVWADVSALELNAAFKA